MTRDDIINCIEELTRIVNCTVSTDDTVNTAISEGERIIDTLRRAPVVDIVTEGMTGYPGEW